METDRSPPFYCLKPAADEHISGKPQLLSVRRLSPLAAAALRCLLHSALALLCELGDVDNWIAAAQATFLAHEVAALPRQELSSFFADHLHADWMALRFMLGERSDDDAAVMLHLLLLDMSSGSGALQAAAVAEPRLEQAAAQVVQATTEHALPQVGIVGFDVPSAT